MKEYNVYFSLDISGKEHTLESIEQLYKKQLFDNVEQYTILKQKRLQQKCGNEHKNGDETNVNDNSEDVKRLKLDQNKSWYFYHLHKWFHFNDHLTIESKLAWEDQSEPRLFRIRNLVKIHFCYFVIFIKDQNYSSLHI